MCHWADTEKPEEAVTYYTKLIKTTNQGAHSQRPEIAYACSFVNRNRRGKEILKVRIEHEPE